MKALILAAGRGKRMRPLTDDLPKPLLEVWGRPMIEWQILGLKAAGISEFVINTAHLSSCFLPVLGHGEKLGVKIAYSREGENYDGALETLGGIAKALPLLTAEEAPGTPFVVVSGDILTNFDYRSLANRAFVLKDKKALGHLVLVPNPPFNPGGDMSVREGLVRQEPKELTYANIGIFSPELFKGVEPKFSKLFPWLFDFCAQGLITGEEKACEWFNVGTPEALQELNEKGKPQWARKLEAQ